MSSGLPHLAVDYPKDHPRHLRVPSSGSSPSNRRLSFVETVEASILESFSKPITCDDSPGEQRRKSLTSERRKSLLGALPHVDNTPHVLDHAPAPGHDDNVPAEELQKELEELEHELDDAETQ